MPVAYASWPFRPMQARSVEETERWWAHCYLRPGAQLVLQDEPHWRVLAGGPGSGKSVVLKDLERREAGTSFIVHYPPERWPETKQAWVRDGNHLAQIMAGAGLAVRDHLTAHPNTISNLSQSQCIFLRWLLEKFGGSRAFLRLVDGLDPALTGALQSVSYEDLYQSCTESLDVQGQIDELASLVRKLGYRRVLVTVDLNQRDVHIHKKSLLDLFGWLDSMHHQGLALAAAVSTEVIQEVIEKARGRVSVVSLKWEAADVREIALRHIRLAVANPKAPLQDIVTSALRNKLETMLIAQYGEPTPAGWVALAETLLYLASRNPNPLPFKMHNLSEIEKAFYSRHMLLQVDEVQHGVWRGPKFIKLTPQPLNFLTLLRERNGRAINSEDKPLLALARSKSNIHSIASRTREFIEPFPDEPIYLRNKRGEGGYWLENFT